MLTTYKKNKIGPGTIVNIVRSGDVIPIVSDVVKGTQADLPDHVSKAIPKFHYKGHDKILFEWGTGGQRSKLDIFCSRRT